MHISLPLHIAIHFVFAVLAGLVVGFYFKKPWIGIIGGVMGGFLIDLDHVLEYFFIFGPHFNLVYFMEGRQFLISNKILLILHAWEYAVILFAAAWFLRRRRNIYIFLLALACGGMVHLVSDCVLNGYPPRNYSIVYRASQGFSASALLNPEQQAWYDQLRQELGL